MGLTVSAVGSRRDAREFLALPWRVYHGDRHWVPPLLSEVAQASGFRPNDDTVVRQAFVARRDGVAVGRVLAAFDPALNSQKGTTAGHLSLFEAVNEQSVAQALFEQAHGWLRDRRITFVRGPVCPAGPAIDELKGLLVEGFDSPPVVLTSYNPPYYQRLFEQAGFEKDADLYAYHLEADRLFAKNPGKAVEYAGRRYGFRVGALDLSDVEREVAAIKHVLDLAVPAEWTDMVPPTLDEVRAMAKRLRPLVEPDLTAIARAGDEPVGFALAIPDYNQILIHLNGRITPLGAVKYWWYRRRLNCARIFIMFVVPAFRQKGVAHACYYRIFERGTARGYFQGEASTIGETNRQMRADIEKMGGERYKTYRVYGRSI